MIIDIEMIRKITLLAIQHANKVSDGKILIKEDYYWSIPKDTKYNIEAVPTEKDLTIGQLSDDVNELLKSLNGEKPIDSYTIRLLSTLLASIGENLPY